MVAPVRFDKPTPTRKAARHAPQQVRRIPIATVNDRDSNVHEDRFAELRYALEWAPRMCPGLRTYAVPLAEVWKAAQVSEPLANGTVARLLAVGIADGMGARILFGRESVRFALRRKNDMNRLALALIDVAHFLAFRPFDIRLEWLMRQTTERGIDIETGMAELRQQPYLLPGGRLVLAAWDRHGELVVTQQDPVGGVLSRNSKP